MISLIDKKYVNRRTVNNSERESRRNSTFTYHLKVDGQRMPVCKEMCLSTLSLNQRMVYNWILNQDVGTSIPANTSSTSSTQPANARPARGTDAKEIAEQSLDSLPELPLNYCRSQSQKCYLEPLFTSMAPLNKKYIDKMQSESKSFVKITSFTKLFNKKNLSLLKPKKYLCDTRCGYDSKTVSEVEYSEHIKRKKEAGTAKETDKERAISGNGVKVFTVDLQSLLICPTLNASSIYYKLKLPCHNFTMSDLKTREVMVFLLARKWRGTNSQCVHKMYK